MDIYPDLIENAREGFFRISPAGRFLRANPALVKMLGFSRFEELVTDIRNVLTQCIQDKGDAHELLSRLRRDGRALGVETIFLRRGETGFWGMVSVTAVRDQSDGILFYEGSLADISDRWETYHWKREAELSLSKNSARIRFFTSMSHELRKLLDPIIVATQTALLIRQKDQLHDCLLGIVKNAEMLLRFVESAMEFAVRETEGDRPREADFHVRGLFTGVADYFAPLTLENGIDLILDVAQDIPEWALGDEDSLRCILEHLLRNALLSTTYDQIVLRAWQEDKEGEQGGDTRLFVSVSDAGDEVPQEERAGIFDPFSHGAQIFGRPSGEYGLGLALGKRLAVILGGDMRLENIPGKGAAFILEVPFRPCPARKRSARDTSKASDSSALRTPPRASNPKYGQSKAMNLEDRLKRMRELFVETVTESMARLGEALARREAEDVANHAHSLVNSAVMCGADELAELSRRIENEANVGHFAEIEVAYRLLLQFNPSEFEFSWHKRFGDMVPRK